MLTSIKTGLVGFTN